MAAESEIIQAIASSGAGDSIMSNISGFVSSAMNFLGNKFLTDEANARSVKLWREQQDYNSPVNQMKRLKEAGLNPALVYGNSSVVGNIQSSPPSIQRTEMPDIGSELAKFSQVKLNQYTGANLMLSNEAIKQNIIKTKAETNKVIQDTAVSAEAAAGQKIHNAIQAKELAATTSGSIPVSAPWYYKQAASATKNIADPVTSSIGDYLSDQMEKETYAAEMQHQMELKRYRDKVKAVKSKYKK